MGLFNKFKKQEQKSKIINGLGCNFKINREDIEVSAYGGFLVSKNVVNGEKIKYMFREESSIPEFNGWNFYSELDDQEYIENPDNFVVLGAKSMHDIYPMILGLFDAPYGTDLCWLYDDNVHIGFYDLKNEREITVEEILNIK